MHKIDEVSSLFQCANFYINRLGTFSLYCVYYDEHGPGIHITCWILCTSFLVPSIICIYHVQIYFAYIISINFGSIYCRVIKKLVFGLIFHNWQMIELVNDKLPPVNHNWLRDLTMHFCLIRIHCLFLHLLSFYKVWNVFFMIKISFNIYMVPEKHIYADIQHIFYMHLV